MRFFTPLVACLMLAAVTTAVEAKSWRGVVPLKSTRADVIKLWGVGTDPRDPGGKYSLENEDVGILYSRQDEYKNCVDQLPPDLVLRITVTPRSPLSLDRAEINSRQSRLVGPSANAPLRSRGFIDDEEGVVVSMKEDYIEQIVYLPARPDRTRCADYYEDLIRFVKEIGCFLCPSPVVACPDSVEAGTVITFSANLLAGLDKPIFKWTVTAGRITEGQGKSTVSVDTTSLAGKNLTATVEVSGLDPACPRTASCTTRINQKRN